MKWRRHTISRVPLRLPALPSSTQWSIHDVDVDEDGHTLFAVGAERATLLAFGPGDGAAVPTPEQLRAPMVRLLTPEVALLANSRVRSADEKNVWIIDRLGTIRSNFAVGDGVEDILPTKGFFVVTYFDEGVFGDTPVSWGGLAVFDRSGAHLWGWNDTIAPHQASMIADCYAAVHLGGDRIALFSYDSFELALLDVATRSVTVHQTPKELRALQSLSVRGDTYFFHRQSGEYIVSWRPGEEPVIIAREANRASNRRWRGLPGGRFLDVSPSDAAVVIVE